LRALVALGLIACGGGNDPADACVKAHEAIIAQVTTVVEHHRDGCAQSGDCALHSSTISCEPGCQVAILASEASAFVSELASLEAQRCPGAPTGCAIEPYCVTAPAVCDAGTCVLGP
jgi:hypothetical protein